VPKTKKDETESSAMYLNVLKCTTALALAMVLAASPAASAAETPEAKSEQVLPSIVVTEVAVRKLVDRILATGTIQSVEEVYVQPLVEGLSIKDLKADVGDKVEAGQVLATLTTDSLLIQKSQLLANKAKIEAGRAQLASQITEAQANADETERQLRQAKDLSSKGFAAPSKTEQLAAAAEGAIARLNTAKMALPANDADMKLIEAQLDDLELRLARTEVKSPVSGVVSARNAKIGAIASGAGQPLFTVIRDGAVELKADVTEGDLSRVQQGQKVILRIVGNSTELSGKVRRIDPTVNAVSRLGTVAIEIDANDQARAGMFASAEIIVAEHEASALPITAVTTNKDGSAVRKVEDNTVKLVTVSTGIQDGDYIEITKGLEAGDSVVAKAGAYVRDGDRINPVQALGETQ
jgi:HlyD family secretion protein